MELHLNRIGAGDRQPDWVAAAVAGFAAGAVLMILELAWTASTGGNAPGHTSQLAAAPELAWTASSGSYGPWRTSQLVAALTLGQGVLNPPAQVFSFGLVGVALITHYVLGVVFGLVLGAIIAAWPREPDVGMSLAIGGGFGVLLYILNFHVLTPVVPWFAEMRGWSTLIGHLVFGMAAALLYLQLARPPAMRGR
jgi:hypothetical protein